MFLFKPKYNIDLCIYNIDLHYSMFLFKRLSSSSFNRLSMYLHYSMFLFKQQAQGFFNFIISNLHYSMFLFKRTQIKDMLISLSEIYITVCFYLNIGQRNISNTR